MRIMTNQPQMHFTKNKPVVVTYDTNITGKRTGLYEFRQGEDYILLRDLQEVTYLIRMGYDVELKF